MKLLRRVAIALVAVLLLALVVGLVLPRRWRVEQSVTINAPPERIHPFIENPRKWQEWAVWTRDMDPQVRNDYGGPESGVGAKWSWLGPKMGRGRLEVIASDPKQGVTVDEAIESDEVNARTTFTFTANGTGTVVKWVDEGTLPPVMGGYFKGMIEEMLSDNFAKGLVKLKGVVEALPAPAAPPPPAEPMATDAGASAQTQP